MGKMRNVLNKQNQVIQSSFNLTSFEFALNGPAKKIHNKKTSFSIGKEKNVINLL